MCFRENTFGSVYLCNSHFNGEHRDKHAGVILCKGPTVHEDSFKLYCQPIVPLNRKYESRPDFFEILVRFNENGSDSIIPTVFMPAAERYHLMPTMDRRILTSALSAISELNPAEGNGQRGRMPLFSINLSGQSLCDDKFLDFVVTQLEFFRVNPGNICFEITETAAIANLTRAKAFITSLKDRGCMFALDDFGSGLSSFGYLKSLPVDYLKIAGNFIQDITNDAVDHAMVEAINQVGHIMGLITVAESVEDDRILEKIRQSGIDYGQGFGIGMPVPVEEVIARYR